MPDLTKMPDIPNPQWFDDLPIECKRMASRLPLTADDWEKIFAMPTEQEQEAFARKRFEEWANRFDQMAVDLYKRCQNA